MPSRPREGPAARSPPRGEASRARLVPSRSAQDKAAFEGLLYWVNMLQIGVRVGEWTFVCEGSCEGKKAVFSRAPANTEAACELFPAAPASE